MYYDKVLFIGSFAQGEFFDKLLSDKAYVQFAANTVEKYYIDGIIDYFSENVDILSGLVTVPYPHCNLKTIPDNETIYRNTKIVNVGFRNYSIINLIDQVISLEKYVKKWIEENKHYKVLIVCYSLRVPFLKAASTIKKKHPNVTVINIVPDLPQFMHTDSSLLRRMLNAVNQLLLDRVRVCVDGYILYAKNMAEAMNLKKPWIVIEGLYDPLKHQGQRCQYSLQKSEKFVFMYAGGISEEYGTRLLVDGFLCADLENAELHIYGPGPFADELKIYTQKHSNIKYFGVIDPNTTYERMLQADVLVNPRPSNNEFTKYSCPSKVIEYMSTGTPVLMTKLEGIPDDYYRYVYTIDDESENGVTSALNQIFYDSEEVRLQKGQMAQSFIYEKKCVKQQMNHIFSWLKNVENAK